MNGLDGIDVSSIQGDIDWPAVRASGTRWAYIRLCRGVDEVDGAAAKNLIQAQIASVLVGVYHRVFPALGSPETHALHFLAVLNRNRDALPMLTLAPALDYEEKIDGGGPWCREYMRIVREATGRREHVLYAPGSWFGTHIGTEAWADPNIRLWVADSGRYTGATKGHPKFQHSQSFAHQWGQTDKQPGVTGLCDLDVSIGQLPLGR